PQELMAAITDIGNQIYVDPDCRAHVRRLMESQGKLEGFEFQAYRKDGQVIWISLNMRAVRDEKGVLLFYEGFNIDITEKKNLQAEIMQDDRLRTIGELAAGVAHEINNPINGIINYAQLMLDQEERPEQEKEVPQRILKEGERIASIVATLLHFARDQREEERPVDLLAILIETIDLIKTQLGREGIQLQVGVSPNLFQIKANAQKIQQVFFNIISNARYALNRKYPETHSHKVIRISGKCVIKKSRPFIQFIFYDHGIGIPNSMLNQIGNPFFTTKSSGEGTGLGLSISLKIIRDYGGRLWFESREGEYTKAIVELPLAE
ncbi:MAG: hybrid sensor histidine kinase/response regulator, partial [Desulfobacca sp.]|nr:hybrid sensor histidine kinase/response regulator [Desulfobacca sp.]